MLIAHQGGWDELLMVLVPIAAVVLLLRLANRRAKAGGPPPVPGADQAELSRSAGPERDRPN